MVPERESRFGAVSTDLAASVEAPELHVVEAGAVSTGAAPGGRMRRIRARIAAGFYDSDEVRSQLVDAMLRRIRRP